MSFEVTWQIKSIVLPLSQSLWSSNLSGWWDMVRSSLLEIRQTPQWGGLGDHVTNHIHYIPMDTKLGKVLTYCERLPLLKPHEHLITWPMWDHVIIWKIYISTFIRLKATKLGSVLTLQRRFSMQTLKSLPPYFNFWNNLLIIWVNNKTLTISQIVEHFD